MNLLKHIARTWKTIRSGGGSLTQSWLRGEDIADGAGANLTSAYQQSTWVYAAITALATNVSQIPFRISQGTKHQEQILERGPAIELFNRPHEYLDRFQFWELLVIWLHLRGEAFVVALDREDRVIPVRRARGSSKIAKLLILSPDRFWHIIEGGRLAGWRYTGYNYNDPPVESQVFLPEEIMQFRLPNPFLFWRGMSPLSVALLAAQTDFASAQFMKGLMLNNADTGVIVTTDQQVSPEQREAILAALRERKRKAGTADRPLFLWNGAKVEKPSATSADLQFLENRKLNRLEIGAVFRVPATVMGFSEDANRAIAAQERLTFVEQTILPLCLRLEAFVAPMVEAFENSAEPRLHGWFHSDSLPIMQEARRTRGQAAAKFFAMGVPLNDINRTFDLGLPEYEWGNTGYLPATLQAVGAQSPAGDTADGEEAAAPGPFARMLELLETSEVQSSRLKVQSSGGAAESIKMKESKLSRFFFEQRGRVLREVQGLQFKVPSLEGARAATCGVEEIFDLAAENAELFKHMKPLLLADFESGAREVCADYCAERSALERFFSGCAERLAEVNRDTSDAIETALQAEQTQPAEMVKRVFQQAADHRARSIAEAETESALNAGRRAGGRG